MFEQTSQKRELLEHTRRQNLQGVLFLLIGFVLFASVIASVWTTIHSSQVSAATSSTINFQARLQNAAGGIVPDGNYNIEFKLYNVSSGGAALWTETRQNSASQGVTVRNGYVSVSLGSVTAFPGTINWDQDLWLTMNIGGTTTGVPGYDGEMNPRLKLTATPYAFQAKSATQLQALQGSYTGSLLFGTLTDNRSISLPDENGTICLQASSNCGFLTTATANTSYIQLQATTPGTAQTGNFNISGTGVAATLTATTALQAPLLDTATATALNIGTTNATSIALGKITSVTANSSSTALTVNQVGAGLLLDLQDNATSVFNVGNTGALTVSTTTPSKNDLQVRSTSGVVLNVDSLGGYVINNGTVNAGNLLQNPSFESNNSNTASGWAVNANGAITIDGANAHSGSNELQIIGNGAFNTVATAAYYAVTPGDTYYLESWTKADSGTNGTASTRMTFYDASKASTSFNSVSANNATTYARGSGTFTVPAGSYYLRVLALSNTSSTTGKWYFDDIVLQKVNQPQSMLIQPSADGTSMLQVQNSSGASIFNVDTTGSGAVTIGTTLSVGSTINAVGGYKFNGTAGATTTCSGGNVLQNAVIQGGIVTGGTCAANGGGVTAVSLQATTPGAAQTGNFNISGTGTMDTLRVNTIDRASGVGALNIGTTANTTDITIGRTGQIATVNSQLTVGGLLYVGDSGTTSEGARVKFNGNFNSTTTTSQYGLMNQLAFNPQGASLNNIYGMVNLPTVASSALDLTTVYGMYTRLDTGASYTGTIANGRGLTVSGPTVGGSKLITDYRGIEIGANASNTGNTTGTINNYQLRIQGNTAGAGTGGTLNNYGSYMTLSSGTGGTTNNYGLFIQGNGGAGSTNYGIYNISTAQNYIEGRVGIGYVSPNYKLDVQGDINTSTVYRVGGTAGLSSLSCTGGNVLQNATIAGGIVTAGSCVANGGGVAPTLQDTYNNSTSPATILLSSTNKGVTIKDASTTVGGNLFAIQNNAGTTSYLAVTTSGASVAGTFTATSGLLAPSLDTAVAGTLSIGNTNATTVQIGYSSSAHNIQIGNNASGAQIIGIGNTDVGSSTAINGKSVYLTAGTGGTITIGYFTDNGTFNLGNGDGSTVNVANGAGNTVNIGTTTGAGTVNIGTAAAARTTTIGSTNTTSATTIQAGSAGITLTGNTTLTGTLAVTGGGSFTSTVSGADAVSTNQFVTLGQLNTAIGGVGSGVTTIGTIDGGTYSANGASISGTTMYLQSASATQVGLVTTGTQTFAGDKTFNGDVSINTSKMLKVSTLGSSFYNERISFSSSGLSILGGDGIELGDATTIHSTTSTGMALNVSGTPTASATSSVILIGSKFAPIQGGNSSTNGGTYIGLNAPNTGAGSAADFLNFQKNGVSKLIVDNTGYIYSATGLNVAGTTTVTADGVNGYTITAAGGGFNFNGTAGSTVSCTGGQVLQNQVVQGGIVTGGTCVANGGGVAPTLQDTYNNATSPATITLNSTNDGITIKDASTTVGGNLFAIQNNAGSTSYLAVTTGGASVAGTFSVTGSGSFTGRVSGADAVSNNEFVTLGQLNTAIGGVGSGVTTIGTIDGGTYSANGASISGTTMYLQSASATQVGLVTTGTQTFAGAKTFNATGTALTVSNDAAINGKLITPRIEHLGSGGTSYITFGNTGGLDLYNPDGIQLSGGHVKIGSAATAFYPLDVVGDINTSTGYRINGTAGSTVSCTAGNVMKDIVVQGGIVTGGTCVANGGGTAGVTLQATTPGTADVGNLNITGTGIFGTSIASQSGVFQNAVTAPSLDTGSAVALYIGATNATSVEVGSLTGTQSINIGDVGNGSATGTIAVGNTGVGATTVITSSNGGINLTSTGVGVGGSSNSATAFTVSNSDSSITALSVDTTGTTAVNIANSLTAGGKIYSQYFDTASAAVLNVGTSNASSITIGTSTGSQAINIGAGYGTGGLIMGNLGAGATTTIRANNSELRFTNAGLTLQTNATGFGSDSASAFVVQNSGDVNLLTVDTSAMQVVVGDTTNGIILTVNGIQLKGTARNAKTIVLTAEYAGAVLDAGSGSNNTGTMTSGNNTSNRMNFYKWTATNPTTPQTYDIVVQVPIPSDFDSWSGATPSITLNTYTTDLTNGKLTLGLKDTAGSATSCVEGTTSVTPGSASTWSTASPSCTGGTYTAGGYMTLRIRMSAVNNSNAQLGNITLNYLSKF